MRDHGDQVRIRVACGLDDLARGIARPDDRRDVQPRGAPPSAHVGKIRFGLFLHACRLVERRASAALDRAHHVAEREQLTVREDVGIDERPARAPLAGLADDLVIE